MRVAIKHADTNGVDDDEIVEVDDDETNENELAWDITKNYLVHAREKKNGCTGEKNT